MSVCLLPPARLPVEEAYWLVAWSVRVCACVPVVWTHTQWAVLLPSARSLSLASGRSAWRVSAAAGPSSLSACPLAAVSWTSVQPLSLACASSAPALQTPLDLPGDLQPKLVDGSWRKPRLSARRAAKLRKAALVDGRFGVHVKSAGEWRVVVFPFVSGVFPFYAAPFSGRATLLGGLRRALCCLCMCVRACGVCVCVRGGGEDGCVTREAAWPRRFVHARQPYLQISLLGGCAAEGWNPDWDKVRHPRILRVPKGTLHDREQPARWGMGCCPHTQHSQHRPLWRVVCRPLLLVSTSFLFLLVPLRRIAKIQKLLGEQEKLLADFKKVGGCVGVHLGCSHRVVLFVVSNLIGVTCVCLPSCALSPADAACQGQARGPPVVQPQGEVGEVTPPVCCGCGLEGLPYAPCPPPPFCTLLECMVCTLPWLTV